MSSDFSFLVKTTDPNAFYSYVNLCWVMGQFIAAGVLQACSSRTDEWGYKVSPLDLLRVVGRV